ncbi:MAG: Sir2 family NAD-dependent protein deacetylase [SAR324 cluster bacterium]|jgi:NAD-dependent deacetylase|nr:Sir2 family NAD-dependent protein deacetylase [SAR324 cluster bacterium]MDP7582795.1 Sir2 family NAD-dependent protein deacetylase [SAR324 cluster bacterium]|tara:strand:+ start:109 stop:843 length:735 start_codon:yes stop_codon:yes gene_type:complete
MSGKLPQELTLSGLREGRASVAAVTGAGIDSEAGLPTFRGDKGYYEDEEATYLASVDALKAEPSRQWHWYLKRFVSYHDTHPAHSHFALAELEAELGEKFLGIITQNVSGLHRKAGSQKVYEIHGSIQEMRNLKTGEQQTLPETWVESPPADEELISWRPHVCFFGESYDCFPLPEAMEVCNSCDILLVIGTSGVVHTPVLLSESAQRSGAVVVNINPHPGEVDKISDMNFRGSAAEYFQESVL